MSQRPYLVSGSLRDQLLYPQPPQAVWKTTSKAMKAKYASPHPIMQHTAQLILAGDTTCKDHERHVCIFINCDDSRTVALFFVQCRDFRE